MEETLGKRIVAHRKKLGLTQDQLAEKLGVTAQAVSKWENDQSCPDIAMLPKLAEIFGCSTDALLGIEKAKEAEIVGSRSGADTSDDGSGPNANWEFSWDCGRRSGLGIALWVLLAGIVLAAGALLKQPQHGWSVIFFSGLTVFGLFGLYPNFSCFRLGCTLFGGFCLVKGLGVLALLGIDLGSELVIPVIVILIGLGLLIDAFRKPKKPRVHFSSKHSGKLKSQYTTDGENFYCTTAFGENHRLVELPRLSGGSASVNFGELAIDLSGCEEIADGCRIEVGCAFGELEILIPRGFRAEYNIPAAFGTVETKGHASADADRIIFLEGSTSFGETTVRYL